MKPMVRQYALGYWIDTGWFVGRIREVPSVFCRGEALAGLEGNIRDAFKLMMKDQSHVPAKLGSQLGVSQ
jgi:predicted RNase H-like HicB family nuclease